MVALLRVTTGDCPEIGCQAIAATLAFEHSRFDQGLYAFLQEKWIALGALQSSLGQLPEAEVVSQQGMEEFLRGAR